MCRLSSFSKLLTLAATSSITNAFVAPSPLAVPSSTTRSSPFHLSASNDDQDNSNSINIAIITSSSSSSNAGTTSKNNESFRKSLQSHPFCQMTGIQLSIIDIPASCNNNNNNYNPWSVEELASLESSDIACFSTPKSVKRYLKLMDEYLNVAEDISDEDRRSLPNKPFLDNDDNKDGGEEEAKLDDPTKPIQDSGIMAACIDTDTAKECLNSGRWMSNHIYYPKGGEAIDLKIEEENSEEGEDGEEEDFDREWTDEMMEVWTASVMQAAGDVMERKFWGGGW